MDGVSSGVPCAQCGSTRRTHEIEVKSAIAISTGVGVGIEHGLRSWQDRWRTFIHHFEELQAIYAGTSLANNIGWEQTVRAVLGDAFHLRDHITANLGPTTDAGNWVDSQPNLSLARDFANTDKHYARANPANRTVYIKGTTSGPRGNTVTLNVETPGAQRSNVDALDVATGCFREWRSYLAGHGLAEPR